MNGGSPWGPPPDWARDLMERARARLRDAWEWTRDAADLAFYGADRVAARLHGRARAGLRRIRVWSAGRLRVRVGPWLRRSGRWLRRHRPTPRQLALGAVVLLVAGWILWARCGLQGCPDVDRLTSYQPEGASVLLDRWGERFADLAPMEYEVVPLDSLPPYVAQAFIAVEDRRFYEHRGVDWVRVLGALWADIRAGGLVEGSSTIPMQLSRTLFSDRIRREEKTLRRKLLEARVAGEIEDRFTKREILELYLNHVYLGGGAYGVQAASRYYFRKDAPALSLEEAALLAALPKAPSHYDPRRHPEAARSRRDLVLTLMERQDVIPFRAAQAARERELGVAGEPRRDLDGDRLAPYFVEHVRRLLEEELGEGLYARRLRVLTTLDPRAQREVEEALEAQLRAVERGSFGRFRGSPYSSAADPLDGGLDYVQGAAVFMDVLGGEIRAWVGGRDFDHSRYDRARLARRQAGSAFKPFVYGTALESGFPPSQPILDAPYRLARRGADDWEPDNYSGLFEGPMSMREALMRSQNVPAVRLAAALGPDRVSDFARRTGLSGEVPSSPVAALGVTTATPLEMAVAYSSFAGQGSRVLPRFILRVEDEDGDVLLETRPRRIAVTDPATAYVLTDMLRDVVDYGTGAGVRRAGYHGPAAGKTGTTNDATDVWFVGYTPELVGTVWVGFDAVRPLAARATGGGVAAPIWGRVMARVDGPASMDGGWEAPEGVVSLRVDGETGMALEEGCRSRWGESRRELFLEGTEPETVCPRHGRDSFLDWLESVFGPREPAPRIPGPTDPDLGLPRLPPRDAYRAGRAEQLRRERGLQESWRLAEAQALEAARRQAEAVRAAREVAIR